MRRVFAGALLVLGIVGGTSEGWAACRWTWDCSSGTCRQLQVCDGPIDLPTIRPPAVSPIAPPSIPPIPQPMIPPLGTSECHQAQLCDNFGRCRWQPVCR
jgi:hypothetical protein